MSHAQFHGQSARSFPPAVFFSAVQGEHFVPASAGSPFQIAVFSGNSSNKNAGHVERLLPSKEIPAHEALR